MFNKLVTLYAKLKYRILEKYYIKRDATKETERFSIWLRNSDTKHRASAFNSMHHHTSNQEIPDELLAKYIAEAETL